MTLDELRALRDQRPFQPFEIHLSDGMNYTIPTPEFVAPKPAGGLALVWRMSGPGFALVALDQITRVTFPDAVVPGEGVSR